MNEVKVIGRTTKDISLSASGETKMARFSVAVNEGKDKVTFIPMTAFGKNAEAMAKYIGKGSLIAVTGHISVSHKADKMYVNIMADRIEYLAIKKPEATENYGSVPDINF